MYDLRLFAKSMPRPHFSCRYLKEMEYSHEVQESEEEARDDEDDLNEDSDEDLCKVACE